MFRLFAALAAVSLVVGIAVTPTGSAIVKVYEDGSIVYADGTYGCTATGLCNDGTTGVVIDGVVQMTSERCAYLDAWGDADCVYAETHIG